MRVTQPPYTAPEELAHALTAGLGIIACVIAIPWLAWATAGDPPRLVAALAFGASALAMFVTSVIYHRERNLDRKVTLRKLDHAAIYLLIAGTYTPFALLAVRHPWGWVLFGVIWMLAIAGIAAKFTVGFRYPRLSTILYLGMGWVGIFAIPLSENLSDQALAWIVAGGVTYTAGVPFYIWKSRRFTHAVWHLFVLGGVACHFAAVLSVVDARGA